MDHWFHKNDNLKINYIERRCNSCDKVIVAKVREFLFKDLGSVGIFGNPSKENIEHVDIATGVLRYKHTCMKCKAESINDNFDFSFETGSCI